ncbi:MAG: lysophospholipid acyltransferase family protein [Planctomycetes bacterium]|nr:lysophospholipid acyltransferase family protein [Planctomycetota bacterium]
MELLREFRKSVTFGFLRIGTEIAHKCADPYVIEGLRHFIRGLSRVAVPLRIMLKKSMKLAGVYRPGLMDEYFDRAIDQLTLLGHIFRVGFPKSGCLEAFEFDDTFSRLQQACDMGKGAIAIAPHLICYTMFPELVSYRIPCSVYMRRTKDPRKFRINMALCSFGKTHFVYTERDAEKRDRLAVSIQALREKRLLYVTADTPRKSHEGVEVSILGKKTYFPTGVFIMSLRTGAPVVPAWWVWKDGKYRISFDEPIILPRGGGITQKVEAATKEWAGRIDRFLREHPEMWWNWMDKRWMRIMRGQ